MTGGSNRQIDGCPAVRTFAVDGPSKVGKPVGETNQADLLFLKELGEAGKVKPMIDRRLLLSDVPAASRYVEDGHARGKVVITVCEDSART
jgi:NADPH:quinone reductase-like Zn-dependent oxidoreductase